MSGEDAVAADSVKAFQKSTGEGGSVAGRSAPPQFIDHDQTPAAGVSHQRSHFIRFQRPRRLTL